MSRGASESTERFLIGAKVLRARAACVGNGDGVASFFGAIQHSRTRAERLASVGEFLNAQAPLRAAADLRGDSVNAWTIAQIGRDEVANSEVLRWLLGMNTAQSVGRRVLQNWFQDISSSNAVPWLVSDRWDGHYSIAVEHCPLSDSASRVDLVLRSETSLVYIEVKVDAHEGREQTTRYMDLVVREARATGRTNYGVVYLSRRPPLNSDATLVHSNWGCLSRAIISACRGRGDIPSLLMLQFAQHVRAF